ARPRLRARRAPRRRRARRRLEHRASGTAAALPLPPLTALATALEAAGHQADAARILRQGVVRPLREVAAALADPAVTGVPGALERLAESCVTARSAEDLARIAASAPATLTAPSGGGGPHLGVPPRGADARAESGGGDGGLREGGTSSGRATGPSALPAAAPPGPVAALAPSWVPAALVGPAAAPSAPRAPAPPTPGPPPPRTPSPTRPAPAHPLGWHPPVSRRPGGLAPLPPWAYVRASTARGSGR
ncbi:hypothetical protein GA0115246_112931, partial [Streptomyces sp. SolWspMP-sol7th]